MNYRETAIVVAAGRSIEERIFLVAETRLRQRSNMLRARELRIEDNTKRNMLRHR